MMSPRKFVARNIVVLNLTYRPDANGEVLPPELHAKFKSPVPVIYNHDHRQVIGKAYLMRVQDTIIADLHIMSAVEDEEEATALVQLMYPSVSARITMRQNEKVLGVDITAISVGFNKNIDGFITPLGTRAHRYRRRHV